MNKTHVAVVVMYAPQGGRPRCAHGSLTDRRPKTLEENWQEETETFFGDNVRALLFNKHNRIDCPDRSNIIWLWSLSMITPELKATLMSSDVVIMALVADESHVYFRNHE